MLLVMLAYGPSINITFYTLAKELSGKDNI